jgi:hypothetical protein
MLRARVHLMHYCQPESNRGDRPMLLARRQLPVLPGQKHHPGWTPALLDASPCLAHFDAGMSVLTVLGIVLICISLLPQLLTTVNPRSSTPCQTQQLGHCLHPCLMFLLPDRSVDVAHETVCSDLRTRSSSTSSNSVQDSRHRKKRS